VEKPCQSPSTPPVKTILKCKNQSYNKWTHVRLHQDPYFKTEKLKRQPIPIPIIETTRKRDPELETNSQIVRSNYIHNVLRRKLSHDSTLGLYQDETEGSIKTGRSRFKYTHKHAFVDGRKYKEKQGF
jgi:hypothetical protein